jgi:hypothetical protein
VGNFDKQQWAISISLDIVVSLDEKTGIHDHRAALGARTSASWPARVSRASARKTSESKTGRDLDR